ncbi:branched-chain amino acid ABC transporter permease [Thalassospira lucentensis]|uniref:branched-chain amino acid ABC transporter permease n=1 Tax=Thalassospira lucentensis TaxID=168935 RepID=UPI0003B516B9|nr:branched-chain amino acid ABC transporter permease [Thalassospira lucentensis]RCK21753.1 branched-chain amino acid ABC transporter permease [Thalassospira lucentensis MCCC 1A00383 = DSM 14000]
MFFSTLVIGLVLGGTYALIALGLTIQYGIARIMNLAYGEITIAGAFFVFLLVSSMGLSPLLGLVLVVPLGFALSWLLYGIVFHPLVKRASHAGQLEIDSILVTFGLMFLAQGLFTMFFGSEFAGYSWLQTPVNLLGAKIAAGRVLGLLIAVLIGGGLWLAMQRTRWGVNLRAVANHPEFAPLVGINRNSAARVAFGLGGAIAAAGGAVMSMYQPFTAVDGGFLTMKALVIVIMGGVGNLGGALMAGLMIGVVEAYVSYAIDPGLTLAATYTIFLGVLLWRPKGLFA